MPALRRELELALETQPALRGRALDTIYFGGGTPSLLDPEEIAECVAHARSSFPLVRDPARREEMGPRGLATRASGDAGLEITLECNPATAETGRLEAFREAGVNRVSLGVQSFDARVLEALGRAHSAEDALEACRRTSELGFESWGLDLMFGVPGASAGDAEPSPRDGGDLARFRADLERTIALAPPHVSVYGLTLHEGTPMEARHRRGEIVLPNEEEQRAMFLLARRMLGAAGWEHYEISNYARPGHESRHNTAYWTGADYLGLGVGAHSHFGGRRWANPPSLGAYLERVRAGRYPAEAEPPPSARALRGERIMLALRRCRGVALDDLNAWLECDFAKEYARRIETLSQRGLLECGAGRVRLTEEGLLLSDGVFEEFF